MSAEVIEGVVLDGVRWQDAAERLWGWGSMRYKLAMCHVPSNHKAVRVCTGHETPDSWMRWPCKDAVIMLDAMGLQAREILVE